MYVLCLYDANEAIYLKIFSKNSNVFGVYMCFYFVLVRMCFYMLNVYLWNTMTVTIGYFKWTIFRWKFLFCLFFVFVFYFLGFYSVMLHIVSSLSHALCRRFKFSYFHTQFFFFCIFLWAQNIVTWVDHVPC